MTTSTGVACTIRDAEVDEAHFADLVVAEAGLVVGPRRTAPAVRIATRGGQVVGFASVTTYGHQPCLDYVYVHHHARRTGIGRALLTDACRLDPSGRRLRIEAHPVAEAFFARVGACREGTLSADHRSPFCRALFSAL